MLVNRRNVRLLRGRSCVRIALGAPLLQCVTPLFIFLSIGDETRSLHILVSWHRPVDRLISMSARSSLFATPDKLAFDHPEYSDFGCGIVAAARQFDPDEN